MFSHIKTILFQNSIHNKYLDGTVDAVAKCFAFYVYNKNIIIQSTTNSTNVLKSI